MKPINDADKKHTIPAVQKAQELMRLLAEEEGETTNKVLAIRLRIPHTTCYRILRTLVGADWVRPVKGGRHELSLGLLPLLKPLHSMKQLSEAVQPALESLAAQVKMTAKVSVRQGDYAVTIARCDSPNHTSVSVRVGASFHLAYGSSGAVLLSAMTPEEVQDILKRAPGECWAYQQPEDVLKRIQLIKAKGWCADAGTYKQSIHTISAPLKVASRGGLAVMTIIGFSHELPPNQLATPAKLLSDAVRHAEKDLRATGSPRVVVKKGVKAKK